MRAGPHITNAYDMSLTDQLRIAIRVDASAQIGTGHLAKDAGSRMRTSRTRRCLAVCHPILGSGLQFGIQKPGF